MNHQYAMLAPNRESVNSEQISTLLHVINAFQAYLLSPHREFDPNNAHPELDGGALATATVTFGNACKKLDEILNDKPRWGLEKANDLYGSLIKTQEAQQALLDAQKKVVEAALLPHSQLKPTIFQYQGLFLAIYGDPSISSGHIVGRGYTPEAALNDFDLAFKRLANDQYQIAVEPGDDTNPKNNKKTK